MIFESSDSPHGENVESGWKYERKNERRTSPDSAHDQGQNRKEQRKECGRHCRELRALAKGHADEERPTCERKTKNKVNNENEATVGAAENAEMPDEGDDDPGGEVCQRYADVPRARKVSIEPGSSESPDLMSLQYSRRVEETHNLEMTREQKGSFAHERAR